MFSRNFYSKYKSYTKSVQSLKEKCAQFQIDTINTINKSSYNVKSSLTSTENKLSELASKTMTSASQLMFRNKSNTSHVENKEQNVLVAKVLNDSRIRNIWMNKVQKKPFIGALGVGAVYAQSTNVDAEKTLIHPEQTVPQIPEPPVVPQESAPDITETFNALGEPTLQSLGIGGWSPVGMVQQCLEYVHVTAGLPWWGSIVVGTIVVRILMFPLVIAAQRNGAKMNNYLPQLQLLQLKMTQARQSGNQLDAARYSQEMMLFMKEKGFNPFKNMLVPLAQMPVFVSFFMGLRGMCNVPVDSFRDGGMLWFVDLTLPDQFFVLPVITSLTLWLTIEVGTDSAKLSAQNMQVMKYVLRAMPLCILPFTINFPGAILCYWVATNFISLAQVGVLKIPTVRDYFKIEQHLVHVKENLPIKNKGFVGGLKDSWANMKITRELEERRQIDQIQFQRAGKGPVTKTYKYDPTKQKPITAAKVIAKER